MCAVCVLVLQAVLGIAPPAGLPQLQVPQLDTAYAPDQNTHLELLMQQQGMASNGSNSALNRAASSNTSFGSGSQVPPALPGGGAAAGDDQQQQQAGASSSDVAAASSSGAAQPSPKPQQLVSPTALPMPRMSNAFARKHGLDPKENPLVNLQRLAMQQQMSPQAAAMVRLGCACSTFGLNAQLDLAHAAGMCSWVDAVVPARLLQIGGNQDWLIVVQKACTLTTC